MDVRGKHLFGISLDPERPFVVGCEQAFGPSRSGAAGSVLSVTYLGAGITVTPPWFDRLTIEFGPPPGPTEHSE